MYKKHLVCAAKLSTTIEIVAGLKKTQIRKKETWEIQKLKLLYNEKIVSWLWSYFFTKVNQKRNAAQKMKGDLQKNTKQASFLFGENKAQWLVWRRRYGGPEDKSALNASKTLDKNSTKKMFQLLKRSRTYNRPIQSESLKKKRDCVERFFKWKTITVKHFRGYFFSPDFV